MKDYSQSSYHLDDGTNISKVFKQEKVNNGLGRWYLLLKQFDIKVISNKNNLILFSINDVEYYYGIPSQKIRRRGDNEWTGKIIHKLKDDLNITPKKVDKNIDTKNEKISDNIFNFGKYKGETIESVKEKDINYYNWCKENIKELKNI